MKEQGVVWVVRLLEFQLLFPSGEPLTWFRPDNLQVQKDQQTESIRLGRLVFFFLVTLIGPGPLRQWLVLMAAN